MDLYTIVLREDVPVDPGKFGPLLAPVLGVTVIEAKIAARRGGILAEDLSEENARRLAESLEGAGVPCWCVPASSLPSLRTPRRVTSIETLDEGVRCTLQGSTEPHTLPWDRIGVVSIGLVLVPELQEEIAGVRKKDVAAIARLEREQRELVRDRLLAVLTRVDPPHVENVPPAGAHHYFFDQLRRDSKQLKGFADLVSADGSEWWRLPLEENGFGDRPNFLAVPILYERRKDAHPERSLKLLQAGNVERLAFHTMEDFNRYTRWWAWRERLQSDLAPAAPSTLAAPGGNGQAPGETVEAPARIREYSRGVSRFGWRFRTLAAGLVLAIALAAGLRNERRGALCLICQQLRQDDVVRLWGIPLRETLGTWRATGPKSQYEELIGKAHEHLYTGYGYEQAGLFGFWSTSGRASGGNAGPEELDAGDCVNGLMMWHATGQATIEEVREAYPRLWERVRNIRDPAGRRKWLDLAAAQPNREAPENLLSEINK